MASSASVPSTSSAATSMHEVEAFVALSKYAGERLDLVQAGGGNSSVKLSDGTMLIKASGCSLSDVTATHGVAKVDNRKVLAILDHPELETLGDKRHQDALAGALMRETLRADSAKPSIETFLHALLDTVTLHTHPVVVNALTCRKDWEAVLGSLFPDAVRVPYQTPGIQLAIALNEQIKAYRERTGSLPQVVFLQNHGLIVSHGDLESVRQTTEAVLSRIEAHLGVDMSRHKLTSQLSGLVERASGQRPVAYRAIDSELPDLMCKLSPAALEHHFCPDGFVFCGFKALRLASLEDAEAIGVYVRQYGEPPKVVLWQDEVFFLAANIRKAKEIEDVFKFHLSVLALAGADVTFLDEQELAYLGNWDAEKYRQKL